MDLTALTTPDMINLNATFASREEAIKALAAQLEAAGKLADTAAFLQAVEDREKEGPTALGEGLAVPHGKSDGVKDAAFAMATLKQDIKWAGLEGDEDVNIIFLLAIPTAEAGSTHIKILTELTGMLVDDDVREAMLAATDKETVLAQLRQ